LTPTEVGDGGKYCRVVRTVVKLAVVAGIASRRRDRPRRSQDEADGFKSSASRATSRGLGVAGQMVLPQPLWTVALSQRCRTCNHADRGQIDVALARGQRRTELSRRYGVPVSSIRRHMRNGHIPPAVVDAFPRHRADLSAEALAQLRCDESAGILLNLARQRRILLQAQDRAEARRDKEWIVRIASALHRNIELTARAVGEFAQHERSLTEVTNLTVMMLPEYVRLRAGLIEALRPFPEARRAVGAVLAELEGAVPHFDGVKTSKVIEARADG
jgi:hypothetical protein